jgi:hypothetical protein
MTILAIVDLLFWGCYPKRRALRRCYNPRLHATVIDNQHNANDGDASALSMM